MAQFSVEVEQWIKRGVDELWPDEVFIYIVEHHEKRLLEGTFHSEGTTLLQRIVKAGHRVLDLGCSTGLLTNYAGSLSASLAVGIDIEMVRLKKAHLRFRAKEQRTCFVLQANLNDSIPLESSFFDVVVMWEVLEHLVHQQRILEEINRVLKPGCHLVLSTPNRESLAHLLTSRFQTVSVTRLSDKSKYYPGFHWGELSRDELCLLVHRSGFDVLEHRFYHYPKIHRFAYRPTGKLPSIVRAIYGLPFGRYLGMNQSLVAVKPQS
jgi:2-polyprenyl-3-methyl-5-hydroxy-6-metoxy-1,4-benzoquinol methylase